MIKLVANKESYGFLGRHWMPGDYEAVPEDTKYPEEHFDIEGSKPAPVKSKEELDAQKIAAYEKKKAELAKKAEIAKHNKEKK